MSDKLQELTERLYREGVEKAHNEAEAILADAQAKKDEVLQSAQNEAQAIFDEGQKELESLRRRVERDLSLAARQAEDSLKQRVATILANSVLTREAANSLSDDNLLTNLIMKLTEAWAERGELPQLSLILSEDDNQRYQSALKKALKERIDQGLTVEFSQRISGGFRLESRADGYSLSFTDKDFEEFFRSFLTNGTRAILFGDL